MRAWLELDLGRVAHNFSRIQQEVGKDVEVIAVVKNDAYGLGLPQVVAALEGAGDATPAMYAVMDLAEAVTVRTLTDKPILLLGFLDSNDLISAVEQEFILTLYDKELVPLVERVAARLGLVARAHVKVDTGLNRLGMSVEEAADFLMSRRLFPHLQVEGIFSHLYAARDQESNQQQLAQLRDLLVRIQDKTELLPMHLASSDSLGLFREGYLDAVRVGAALYGEADALPGLSPAVTAKARVAQLRRVEKDDGVGYDHLYRAEGTRKIAIVTAGYGEGLSQQGREKLSVLIDGQRSPILGQVSMNMMAADVTAIEGVKRGDEVVLIGDQTGKNGQSATIGIPELAKALGIGHHEVITRLGTALPKFYSEAK